MASIKGGTATRVALTAVSTALVYAMTCIAIHMPPPLGVWHAGDVASWIVAILFGPYVGAFACGVGAMLFDLWNPLYGSAFQLWAPATLVIRGLMGFLVGSVKRKMGSGRLSDILAMVLGMVEKNTGYFLYDYMLFGSYAILDLVTFYPLDAIAIIVTVPILMAVRKATGLEG